MDKKELIAGILEYVTVESLKAWERGQSLKEVHSNAIVLLEISSVPFLQAAHFARQLESMIEKTERGTDLENFIKQHKAS